jgi:arginase family enzyme
MPKFSKEKRERLRALAEGDFLTSKDPNITAFLSRAVAEKAPLFEDAFAGQVTCYNAPSSRDLEAIDVALVGVPFEVTAPVRAGARFGPRSFREWAAYRGPVHDTWKTIPFELCSVADYGDVGLPSPHDAEDITKTVTEAFSGFRAHGIAPFSIGGVHTMSYPILKGLTGGEPVGLVHIDAHGDTARGVFQGGQINDCCVFLKAVLDEAIDPERSVQIGLRGALSNVWEFSEDSGLRVIPMHEVYDIGVEGVIEEIRRVIGDGPFYFSIDSDGIDAAYFPGTQFPEPFGLTSREMLKITRCLRGMDMIGADIAELCPPYDPHGISANFCSALGFEILCVLAEAHVARHGQRRKTHWN